jgi:hypothetical protein
MASPAGDRQGTLRSRVGRMTYVYRADCLHRYPLDLVLLSLHLQAPIPSRRCLLPSPSSCLAFGTPSLTHAMASSGSVGGQA